MSEDIYSVNGVTCIHCGVKIEKIMTMANGRDGQLHKGQILICSACGKVQILGDTEWRPLNNEDFNSLPEASQRALMITANGLTEMLERGQEWDPYHEKN